MFIRLMPCFEIERFPRRLKKMSSVNVSTKKLHKRSFQQNSLLIVALLIRYRRYTCRAKCSLSVSGYLNKVCSLVWHLGETTQAKIACHSLSLGRVPRYAFSSHGTHTSLSAYLLIGLWKSKLRVVFMFHKNLKEMSITNTATHNW